MFFKERKNFILLFVFILLSSFLMLVFNHFKIETSVEENFASSYPTDVIQPTKTQIQTSTPALTKTVFPDGPVKIWISPFIPSEIVESYSPTSKIQVVQDKSKAEIILDFGNDTVISRYFYTLVAPFPTVTDTISSAHLASFWKNGTAENFSRLIVSGSTHYILSQMWGKSSNQVTVVQEKDLLSKAWDSPGTWAIVPFETLVPKWKVIAIDGQSPIHRDFDQQKYALGIPISVYGTNQALSWFIELDSKGNTVISSNRDPSKLTTVMLTGVTALVRGTADMMELKGMAYPATDIRDLLSKADILHINNEVPFTPKCPPSAQRVSNQSLVFCSKPEYIELLEDIGTDIIELSGDHLQDWGPEAVLYTIQMYQDRGWSYYGGGVNTNEAKKPLLVEHNGNKIAFLGCNAKPKGYAGATETNPGAVSCDFDYLDSEIKDLLGKGFLPIVTFQHEEIWQTDPPESVKKDFYKVAQSGAVIVSGSQSHQPQTFEFSNDSFMHFGLGNLFFDQVFEGDPNKQAFIDQHFFYDGKFISTELLTIIFVDLARSRPMTSEEREKLLTEIFIASSPTYK